MKAYIAYNAAGQRKIVGNQADAKKINKEYAEIEVPLDKPNLIVFIQTLFTEIDEVEARASILHEKAAELLPSNELKQTPEPQTSKSAISNDEWWENLPIQLQLHFCALLMEELRGRKFI